MGEPVLPIEYRFTQTQIDNGDANTLSGVRIAVIDTNGQPTGKMYESGPANTVPTETVTGSNINTVLASAGGAGWVKIQATVPNYTITRPTSGAGLDLHIEAGSLAALTSIAWPVPVSGVDQLRIRNFSGQAQTFTAGVGWTIVTADGNPVTSGSYSIPDDRAVEVTLDPNGFAQVVPWGGEVSLATFNTHTGNTSNPHVVTKAQVQLGNADNTSDVSKPVSTAQQTALNLKQDASTAATDVELTAHTGNTVNPHSVTKAQVSLGNVDNTSDLNKPVSTAEQTALNLKANLASPALAGIPTAPTAALATNTMQLATTAFVQAATAALVDTSPATLDTLNELAAALGDDPNYATTMTTALGLKAPIASPTFTGTPAVPTPAVDTNTTQAASTTWVNSQLSGTLPVMDGTATVGTGNRSARGNHVHPKDTAKQDALVSGMTVKTINNASVLGSGDIVITPTTVSSTVPTHNLDLVSDNYAGRALHLRPNGMTATANLVTWSDSSGNSRDVAQATAGNQPDVVLNVLNGFPVVRFDGVDDFMGRVTFDMGTSHSILAVFRTGATVVGQVTSEEYQGGATNIRCVLGAYADGAPVGALRFSVFNGSWVNANDSVAMAANTTYLASGVRVSGGTTTLWKNGIQVAQVASGTNPDHNAARQLYVGKSWVTGAGPFWDGDIAEVVIFPAALTTIERQKVEGYLAHKYGLLASLDAGHPYKVTAPQAGDLQTHADNTAAITGGLAIGQVYMTATGQLMVRF